MIGVSLSTGANAVGRVRFQPCVSARETDVGQQRPRLDRHREGVGGGEDQIVRHCFKFQVPGFRLSEMESRAE